MVTAPVPSVHTERRQVRPAMAPHVWPSPQSVAAVAVLQVPAFRPWSSGAMSEHLEAQLPPQLATSLPVAGSH